MQLENQVCNLELAKKLKELGVKQKSLFHYSVPVPERAESEIDKKTLKGCGTEIFQQEMSKRWGKCFDEFSAFTVAELGEILPIRIIQKGTEKYLTCRKVFIGWKCGYFSLYAYSPRNEIAYSKEADARAKMLVYLLENDLITL